MNCLLNNENTNKKNRDTNRINKMVTLNEYLKTVTDPNIDSTKNIMNNYKYNDDEMYKNEYN